MNEIYPSMAGQPAPNDQLDPKTVSHLLGMATSPPAHPADALAIKLADPEGREWAMQALSSPPIEQLSSDDLLESPTDLELLRKLHQHGKRMFHDSSSSNEQHEGMLWYLVAIALAMETPYVPPSNRWTLSGGYGYFEDQNALSVAGAIRANEYMQFSAGVGVGLDSDTVGARAGFSISR